MFYQDLHVKLKLRLHLTYNIPYPISYIYFTEDMSLLETADAKELRSIFSYAGDVCNSDQC